MCHSSQIPPDFGSKYLHVFACRLTGWLRLEGASGDQLVQPPPMPTKTQLVSCSFEGVNV